MVPIRRSIATGAAVATLAFAVVGAACGETGVTDPTPVATFKITPAANATLPPPTAPASDPTAEATKAAEGPLTLAAINNAFDSEELTAPAGTVTIELDNRDGGVVHNLHVYKGDDADGESVGETDLEVGPVTQTLTMELDPGDYFYVCDAHPNTMSGTLRVK